MALEFSKLIYREGMYEYNVASVESLLRTKMSYDRLVFMSHKMGDKKAEDEAKYINREHDVWVYMAEWDDKLQKDTSELPKKIMDVIKISNGFLVHVIEEIKNSMWIGYEIGGAHASNKKSAKIMYNYNGDSVYELPSVVKALYPLDSKYELDNWIEKIK